LLLAPNSFVRVASAFAEGGAGAEQEIIEFGYPSLPSEDFCLPHSEISIEKNWELSSFVKSPSFEDSTMRVAPLNIAKKQIVAPIACSDRPM
jgi:hypothetical protein